MSKEKYIYMAGLIDGEGTIGIAQFQKGRFRSPYISVASTTFEFMEWLQGTFGGYVSVKPSKQENHKTSWTWCLRKKSDLFLLLENIEPFLKEPNKKKRAAKLLGEYQVVTKRNGKYTEEEFSAKVDFERELLDIK